MVVMKFGGTSLGSASRMLNSAEIIRGRARNGRIGVILSAVGGVTNRLQDAVDQASACFRAGSRDGACGESDRGSGEPLPAGESASPDKTVREILDIHEEIISGLSERLDAFRQDRAAEALRTLHAELSRLVNAVSVFGECPNTIYCRIMGMGERFSLPIMAEILRAQGEDVEVLDIRNYIVTDGNPLEGDPVPEKINEAFAPLAGETGARILLGSGFISSDITGNPSLLGRNGSDVSAALMAMGLCADRLEIWTDVDGIFTADPRIVPDAQLVDYISYEEAAELSFFGSKVLHPKTLGSLAAYGIETLSLNSFNPSAKGTLISSRDKIPPPPETQPVRGVSVLKDVAIVSVSGIGLKGKTGSAARIFNAVGNAGVSVLLITQSSSEYTVTFCVKACESRRVRDALQVEFAFELREHLLNDISTVKDVAIISIVGDAMKKRFGIAGKFLSSLSFAGVNILAIAQGASERSISAVIDNAVAEKAVKIVHGFLFNTMQRIEVFLFGVNTVAARLLDRIHMQREELRKNRIDLRVCGVSDLRRIVFSRSGMDLDSWREALEGATERFSVDSFLSYVREEQPLNPVFVDCSMDGADGGIPAGAAETAGSSEDARSIAWHYPDIFSAGVHIVTLNMIANTLPHDFYVKMHRAADLNKKHFLYGGSVGAGLPVVDLLRTMVKTGDFLVKFEGITSDVFSLLFKEMENGRTFSQAVSLAREKGALGENPVGGLSPDTLRRNALVIAREAGFPVDVDDIVVQPLFPDAFAAFAAENPPPEAFMEKLPSVDAWFASKVKAAEKHGKKLRYASVIENGGGCASSSGFPPAVSIKVGFVEVSPDDPLSDIRCAESVFAFTTRSYSPFPLVLQGYGSNAETSASGLFTDILRTASW